MTTVRPAGTPVIGKGRVAALEFATAGFAAGFRAWALPGGSAGSCRRSS
jgi:hypothetical protein